MRCLPEGETADCGVLASAFRTGSGPLVTVHQTVCNACCAAARDAEGPVNPVLASLLYRRADAGLATARSRAESRRLGRVKEEARHRLRHLSPWLETSASGLGILGRGEHHLESPNRTGAALHWAVAVTTAPREQSTLGATLASLSDAGFSDLRLFAEPGSDVPDAWAHLPLLRHARRQGPIRNLCLAARGLLEAEPDADGYAIFQDDLSVARGLRAWCDRELWPGGHGLVSLYTSRVFCDERRGWQALNLGRYRTFGALAFVFRGDTLRGFLGDPEVRRRFQEGIGSADGLVGEWALRAGVGIAYHSPSLVQHEGTVTSLAGHEIGRVGRAVAVPHVDDLDTWQAPTPRPGRVGLVGWNTATGLGYQNRDLALRLPVDCWLAPQHPRYPTLGAPTMPGAYLAAPPPEATETAALRDWLRGLDWLLFVEHPYLRRLPQQARSMGISVACVPNWEWLTPDLDWLPYVDLMLCPTHHTFRMLQRWRRERGFAWDVVHVPWPIDAERFAYRCRERCRRFLFVNGTGGVRGRRAGGAVTRYRRKGIELLAATARLLKSVPFLLYSQTDDLPALPGNIEVRPAPPDNIVLYEEGDVCVQPSHWEGLGLQLLECQAAGMPLVTTDAAPMNECRPLATVPVHRSELVFVYKDQPVEAQLMRPSALAHVLGTLYQSDTREASRQARLYVEQERSWPRARQALLQSLTE